MELNKYAPASELCTAMLELKVWVLENMAWRWYIMQGKEFIALL
jgi:hypothetical protein